MNPTHLNEGIHHRYGQIRVQARTCIWPFLKQYYFLDFLVIKADIFGNGEKNKASRGKPGTQFIGSGDCLDMGNEEEGSIKFHAETSSLVD